MEWFLRYQNNKRRKLLLLLAALLFAGCVALFFVVGKNFTVRGEPLYIAVAGTLSGDREAIGLHVLKGVQLYIDELNQRGGISGRPVEVIELDDRGQLESVQEKVTRLAKDDRVLAVIGHDYSSISVAAGKVYRDYGIPAVTASSTSDTVTRSNEWYFSVTPNNKLFGAYLANYARAVMGHDKAIVIYNPQDDYSSSLLEHFEYLFRGLGGKIDYRLQITDGGGNTRSIIAQLLMSIEADEPCLVMLASQAEEAEAVIVQLKRSGLQCDIMGGDALVPQTFTDRFNKYPEEVAQPGYFTDNIYASTPMIYDVAGLAVHEFEHKYFSFYNEKPSWQSIYGFDAAKLILSAIEQTKATGKPEHIAEQRAAIRAYLEQQKRDHWSVEGVSGKIFFDKDGAVVEPVFIGVHKSRRFVSAFTQFSPIDNAELLSDFDEQLIAGKISALGGRYAEKRHIVYTGMDFNEVNDIDIQNQTYSMDFYLWFRFDSDIDVANIEFTNALDTVKLGDPIVEKSLDDGVSYQLYHVKGKFTAEFNLEDYPFDKQTLYVRFRHAEIMHGNLTYVVDLQGMGEVLDTELMDKELLAKNFNLGDVWRLNDIRFFQETMANNSTLGDPEYFNSAFSAEYSTIEGGIVLERDVLSFIVKHLLPVLFVICLAYLGFYLPSKQFSTINALLSGSLLSIAFFHLSLSSSLPGIGYYVALDYVFYVLYLLIIFGLMITLINWRSSETGIKLRDENKAMLKKSASLSDAQHKKVEENKKLIEHYRHSRRKRILLARAVYPLTLLLMGVVFFYVYCLTSSLQNESLHKVKLGAVEKNKSVNTPQTPVDDTVVLRLSSWRVPDIDKWEKFLAVFNGSQQGIQVKFDPTITTEYNNTLALQLKSKSAPDLLMLRGSTYSDPLYRQGYLTPLNTLPGLRDNFDQAALQSWTSDDGDIYGLPLQEVSQAVYYNADIFSTLNLPEPKTWQELLRVAAAIKRAGYTPFANGTATKWSATELIFMSIADNFIGGREGRLAYQKGERCFNDKSVIDIFRAIADLKPFLSANYNKLNNDGSVQLFLQGEAAMYIGGSWIISQVEQEAKFRWNIFAVPAKAGSPATIIVHPDAAIGINAASLYQKEAREFLQWLMNPQSMALFEQLFPGFYPMNKNKTEPSNRNAAAFLALRNGRGTDQRWLLPEGVPDAYTLMYTATVAVLESKMTPEQAANYLQRGLAQWYEPAQLCSEAKSPGD